MGRVVVAALVGVSLCWLPIVKGEFGYILPFPTLARLVMSPEISLFPAADLHINRPKRHD